MASYLLPSSFQKRLLRYALSRLELLDTDDLDLEDLDIAWGRKSTVELRNVGLKLHKLAVILHLRQGLELVGANILLLRITVPADIYNSPVVVEVEGVHARLRGSPEGNDGLGRGSSGGDAAGLQSSRLPSGKPHGKSPTDMEGAPVGASRDEVLPSTADLAMSFLHTEPVQEKAELEAALSAQSQSLPMRKAMSDGENGDPTTGTGIALTLPSFVAGFLKGIGDRLEVRIRGIEVTYESEIPSDTGLGNDAGIKAEWMSIKVTIADVEIEGVTTKASPRDSEDDSQKATRKASGNSAPTVDHPPPSSSGAAKREIRLQTIHVKLLSDSAVFSTYAKPSSTDSPAATHTSSPTERSGHRSFPDRTLQESLDRPWPAPDSITHPEELLDRSPLSSRPSAPSNPQVGGSLHRGLDTTDASDDGRYSDVSEDENAKLQAHTESAENIAWAPSPHSEYQETPYILRSAVEQWDDDRDSDDVHHPAMEDLSASRIFTHEEAESMYMSAVSHIPTTPRRASAHQTSLPSFGLGSGISLSTVDGPGIRDLAASDPQSSSPSRLQSSPKDTRTRLVNSGNSDCNTPPPQSNEKSPFSPGSPKGEDSSFRSSRESCYRPQEPSEASKQSDGVVAKNILNVDEVTISLPSLLSPNPDPLDPTQFDRQGAAYEAGQPWMTQTSTNQSANLGVHGSFSSYAYNGRSSTSTGEASILTSREAPFRQAVGSAPYDDLVQVQIGKLRAQVDFSVGRILLKLIQNLMGDFGGFHAPLERKRTPDAIPPSGQYRVRVKEMALNLVDQISAKSIASPTSSRSATSETGLWDHPDTEVLLRASAQQLDVDHSFRNASSLTKASAKDMVMGYAKENILWFDADGRMLSSTDDTPILMDKDVVIFVTQTGQSRKVHIATLPVHVTLDLQRLDETFSWFGGMSSILGLGNSIASTTTVTGLSAAPGKAAGRQRGVHFEADSPSPNTVKKDHAASKVDVKIGGVALDLVGKECCIQVRGSAVKVVNRQEGIGAQIDRVKLLGPFIRQIDENPSVIFQIRNVRVEYLSSPREEDLSRLLALLTPSKTRFDRDDDVLLDTLLRQRRQGSVLRITVAAISGNVISLSALKYLPALASEISRLSRVTKYLPEDDRPGILTLGLVRSMDMQVDFEKEIGQITLKLQDVEGAHITLPSLLALGIRSIDLCRNSTDTIICKAESNRPDATLSPMLMARMIGDELEPTVRIKLRNVCAEYRPATIIALFGLSQNQTAEELVVNLAQSLVTLDNVPRRATTATATATITRGSDLSGKEQFPGAKPVKVDIVLHDCTVGLNPVQSPSKGLVVLTEAHFHGVTPMGERFQATAEIHKASLLIIDNTDHIQTVQQASQQSAPRGFDVSSDQVSHLCAKGFVSVGYMSSAKATVSTVDLGPDVEKSIDIILRDDLLLLETCADSTQTLLGIFNGLGVPTPPSEDRKYRTEIVPIHDMLASLSGDAFPSSDTMSGVGEGSPRPIGGDFTEMEPPSIGDLVPSFYNPEEAITPEHVSDSLFMEEPVEGLDSASLTTRDSGYKEEHQMVTDEQLEFHDNHFGPSPEIEGTAHNWDSLRNTYSSPNREEILRSPFRVRVRDVHIIWNLYDGYDWQSTRDTVSKAVRSLEEKAVERRGRSEQRNSLNNDDEQESVIGDFLFNSIYIGIPANRDPRDLSGQISRDVDELASESESYAPSTLPTSPGRELRPCRPRRSKLRLHRSKHHKMAIELKGLSVDVVVFRPGMGETESSIDVRLRDVEIFDHVPTSTWKKFVTYMQDAGERESGSDMVHLEILTVRPIPDLAASEFVVKASILPLRLHVDQDALDFLTRFFEFKEDKIADPPSRADLPFLQRVEVQALPIRLDYKPKNVDYAGLRSGHTTEFMNFITLDEADMVLRHVIIYGVLGFDKLSKTLNDIWMPDIKKTQLSGVIAGLAPVRSIANVGSGVRNLVVIPIQEYKKDGRVVRSIQKGAFAFAKTTTTELVKLGAKLAIGTQTILQGAEDSLSKPAQHGENEWEAADLDEEERKSISLYADQPGGVAQGLRGAYANLERDLLTARDAIVAVPGEILESGNARGAAKAVFRRAPTIILRPAIGASKAVSQTLMGATNALDPQHRRRIDEKYKRH
ncbi:MAG: autophagy- protein 2 [Piccolia ochrophora]|nr:MAG: autophagy- protein 2 [Piccolia ochrophora]